MHYIRSNRSSLRLAGVSLALALASGATKANAAGWPWSKSNVQPKTQTGGGSPPKASSQGASTDFGDLAVKPDLGEDFNRYVDERIGEYGQKASNGTLISYLYGRDNDAETLRSLIDANHTVMILSSEGGGGRSIVEHLHILYPTYEIVRLNPAAMLARGEMTADHDFKQFLEDLSKRAKTKKVLLLIDNAGLQSLKKGGQMARPLDTLRAYIGSSSGPRYVIISDANTAATEFLAFEANKDLPNYIRVFQDVKNSYEQVFRYIQLNISRLQLHNPSITIHKRAMQEAARLAATRYAKDPYKAAWRILITAMNEVEASLRSGMTRDHQLRREITMIEAQLAGYENDMKHFEHPVTDPAEERARITEVQLLNKLTADANKKLMALRNELFLGAVLDSRQEAAKLAYEEANHARQIAFIEQKIHNIEAEEAKRTRTGTASGRQFIDTAPLEQAQTELREAKANLQRKRTRIAQIAQEQLPKSVGAAQVISVVAKDRKIDPRMLTASFDEAVRGMDELKTEIYGQDHAIDALRNSLMINATHLEDGKEIPEYLKDAVKRGEIDLAARPRGAYLFAGPTGVGKTELLLQFAERAGLHVVRINMNEYTEGHTVSALVGSPPGYVGYGEDGILVKALTDYPESLVIFDELEKGAPELHNYIMNILDTGYFDRRSGVGKVDARRALFGATSNLAQNISRMNEMQLRLELAKAGVSQDEIKVLAEDHALKKNNHQALKQRLWVIKACDGVNGNMKPEFAARWSVIVFEALGKTEAMRIAKKLFRQVQNRLDVIHDVQLRFTPDAIRLVSERFNESLGGRAVRHAFDDLFRGKLAEAIFNQGAMPGDVIAIGVETNNMGIEVVKLTITTPAEIERVSHVFPIPQTGMQGSLLQEIARGQAPEQIASREARAATTSIYDLFLNEKDGKVRKMLITDRAYRMIRGK